MTTGDDAMPDKVAMRTAARELGLKPRQLELAVQLGHVRTVSGDGDAGGDGGAGGGSRRVPREELERLKGESGFPATLRERVRVVGTARGAELLGVTTARFTRLARGGCFGPAQFYVNRYRAVVWLYLATELAEFAGRRPELLSGALPRGLRVLLDEGADHRPQQWRDRRVEQLIRQAPGPWERAAVRASLLDDDVLEEAVPDPAVRARLLAHKPELAPLRQESPATREVVEELCLATGEDELLYHRLLLLAELDGARSSERTATAPPPATRAPVPVAAQPSAEGPPRTRRWRDRLRHGAVVSRPAF